MRAGPISFAGHSLGGSLSKVLAARLVASGHRRGADVFVHTFGSPPAFSCSCGGHGSRIMQHLRILPSHLRNWVRPACASSPIHHVTLLPMHSRRWHASTRPRSQRCPLTQSHAQVLDYDPVPRAMISADPYYQLALKNSVRICSLATS